MNGEESRRIHDRLIRALIYTDALRPLTITQVLDIESELFSIMCDEVAKGTKEQLDYERSLAEKPTATATLSAVASLVRSLMNSGHHLDHFVRDIGYKAPEIIAEELPAIRAQWADAENAANLWFKTGKVK
jgi:hypothetical protein